MILWHPMIGREEMFGQTTVATIMRKGDEGPGRPLYVIVRSPALAGDKVITVSREDYDQLHPGMLVNVQRVGWGVFSTWRLKR
jgi:hypothetical protein